MLTTKVCSVVLLGVALSTAVAAQPPETGTQAGGLTIERVEQGLVFAPDARVTEVNGETAALAGGYVGWLTDRTWLIGGGGYWLANQDTDLRMAYGGVVVEYLARSEQRIGFGVRSLVGGGRATLGTTAGDYFGADAWPLATPTPHHGPRMTRLERYSHAPITADTQLLVREYFFVVEPTASVVWHFTRWARLDVGLGYRLAAGAGRLDDELRGASASVAVQFGGSRRARP